jgi:hypothetical protein
MACYTTLDAVITAIALLMCGTVFGFALAMYMKGSV